MKNIYQIFDHLEKRPALFLGHNVGIIALNHFVTGYCIGGGNLMDKKINYPDFSLFTDWLGGVIMKSKYEGTSSNWSWMLMNKYKDDKIAFSKFFYYLKQFKTSEYEVIMLALTKENIQYSIEHKTNELWCGISNNSKLYTNNLKKLDKIVLFKLLPSRTLFSLFVSDSGKIIDTRNIDQTGKFLMKKIEKQFGIDIDRIKGHNSLDSIAILKQFKII